MGLNKAVNEIGITIGLTKPGDKTAIFHAVHFCFIIVRIRIYYLCRFPVEWETLALLEEVPTLSQGLGAAPPLVMVIYTLDSYPAIRYRSVAFAQERLGLIRLPFVHAAHNVALRFSGQPSLACHLSIAI